MVVVVVVVRPESLWLTRLVRPPWWMLTLLLSVPEA